MYNMKFDDNFKNCWSLSRGLEHHEDNISSYRNFQISQTFSQTRRIYLNCFCHRLSARSEMLKCTKKTPENKWFGVTKIYFCIFLWHGLFKWFISKVQQLQKPNLIMGKVGKATCFAEEPSVCSYSKDVPPIGLDKTPRRAPAIFL